MSFFEAIKLRFVVWVWKRLVHIVESNTYGGFLEQNKTFCCLRFTILHHHSIRQLHRLLHNFRA